MRTRSQLLAWLKNFLERFSSISVRYLGNIVTSFLRITKRTLNRYFGNFANQLTATSDGFFSDGKK